MDSYVAIRMDDKDQGAGRAVYQLLTIRTGEIRILSPLPSADSAAPLCGTLRKYRLESDDSNQVDFDALSYAWGDPTPVSVVNVQRGPDTSEVYKARSDAHAQQIDALDLADKSAVYSVPIAQNLAVALAQLRPSESTFRQLWIDAICINQHDEAEKAVQVMQMNAVYRAARHTLIWLGSASANSADAMRLAEEMSQRFQDDATHEADRQWLAQIPQAQGDAYSQLLQRPWWKRLWVVQEIMVNSAPLVLCGPDSLPLEVFERLVLSIKRNMHRFHGTTIGANFFFLLRNKRAERRAQKAGRDHILLWLHQTGELHCALPRDRLYALLALCYAEDRAAIPVNYNETELPDATLYCAFTRYVL